VSGGEAFVMIPLALLDDAGLSVEAVLLWAMIRRRNGEAARGSWEALATLAARLGSGVSSRRLRRAYDLLLAHGLLVVQRRGQGQTALRWALRPGAAGDRELAALTKRGAITTRVFEQTCRRRADAAPAPNQDVAPVPRQEGPEVAPLPGLDVAPVPRNAEPGDAEPKTTPSAAPRRRAGASEAPAPDGNGGPPALGLTPPAPARPNWVTALGAIWRERYGGEPAFGALAGHCKKLVDAHGLDEVARRFTVYVQATEARFVSPARFAQTFGDWGVPGGARPPTDAERMAALAAAAEREAAR